MKQLTALQIDADIVNRFSDDIAANFKQKLVNGSLRGIDSSLKHRVLVPVSEGSKPLLKSTNNKVDGVSDFDSNSLPIDELRTVTEFYLGYAFHADADKEHSLAYGNSFPESFRNAQLQIKQAGKLVLDQPISELIIAGTPTNADDKYIVFTLPYPLVGVKKTEIDIIFAEGAAAKVVSTVPQKEYLEIIQKGRLYIDKV